MAEPIRLPAPKPPCPHCGGEGFVFRVAQGRATAEACACTRDCPACGGSGRLYGTDSRGYSVLRGCTCGCDPRRLSLLSGLRLPIKFLQATLDGYRPKNTDQAKAVARSRRFADEFVPQAAGVRALLFCGPPGTGKTHLLAAMLRELALRKAVRGRYEEFFLLLSDIRDGFSKGMSSREWLEPLRSVEVLAIDEIGKGGKNREFEQGVLDEIISVRYNAGRPTLLATNYPRAGSTWKFGAEGEVAETLEQRVGSRIYSRLHDLCDVVDVVGPDHRKEQHDVREARSAIASPQDAHARGTRPARG
jgi:DNA replication protein DnaC